MPSVIEEAVPIVAEETIGLADFLGDSNLPNKHTEVTVSDSPTKSAPAEKTEEQKLVFEEKPVVIEDKPAVEAPVTPPLAKTQPAEIDLTDVDEADRALLKKMSNDAKQRFVALSKAQKTAVLEYNAKEAKLREELKAATEKHIPSSYYEHPDAYVLTPEFKSQADLQQRAVKEHAFWKEQYSKIRRGEEWTDIEVDASGKIVNVTRQPTADAEADVLDYINETRRVANESSASIEKLKATFANQHKTVSQRIEEAAKKFFPPELHDYDKALKENNYVKVMHNALADINQTNNPLAKEFVRLYAIHMDTLNKYLALKNTPSTTPTARPNNITSRDAELGKTSQAPANELSLDEFMKHKRQD